MEHGSFVDDLPIKNCDVQLFCLLTSGGPPTAAMMAGGSGSAPPA